MSTSIRERIEMHKAARGLIDKVGLEPWYSELTGDRRVDACMYLLLMCYQARFNRDDLRAAMAGVGKTGVPLVNELSREPLSKVDTKRLNKILVKCGAGWSVFLALLELLGAADARRMAEECGPCNRHWWHMDLMDPVTVERVVNDHG